MAESLDQNIGRLIKTLEDQGVRDNTAVFFLNDNGSPGGEVSSNETIAR